jgi:hypothetical protein
VASKLARNAQPVIGHKCDWLIKRVNVHSGAGYDYIKIKPKFLHFLLWKIIDLYSFLFIKAILLLLCDVFQSYHSVCLQNCYILG